MSERRFSLKPYRLRLRDQAFAWIFLAVFGLPVGSCLLATGANSWLGFDFRISIFVSAALVACGLCWLAWIDHRMRPAGELRVYDGLLEFTAWSGKPIRANAFDVTKIIKLHYKGSRSDVLVIYLAKPARKVFVHAVRLERATLAEVEACVMAGMNNYGRAPAIARSSDRFATLLSRLMKLGSSRWLHAASIGAAILAFALSRK